ncbi:unnamed protein product [Caenorhabditis auriculariae]|uniref:Uncharacterized protein n=1 Tax=Caenorhabditis auriculariae TaxID=2777116 RepID=A0A8S1HFI5_9PELO|nr:unnamed protein product [Caenorhabditis auriculariae]
MKQSACVQIRPQLLWVSKQLLRKKKNRPELEESIQRLALLPLPWELASTSMQKSQPPELNAPLGAEVGVNSKRRNDGSW